METKEFKPFELPKGDYLGEQAKKNKQLVSDLNSLLKEKVGQLILVVTCRNESLRHNGFGQGPCFYPYSGLVKEAFYLGVVGEGELEIKHLNIRIPTCGRHVCCYEGFEGRQFSLCNEDISFVLFRPSLFATMEATVKRVLQCHDQPELEIIIGNQELIKWLEERVNCFSDEYLDVYYRATRKLEFPVMSFPSLEAYLIKKRAVIFKQIAYLLHDMYQSNKWIRGDISAGEPWRTEWKARDEKEKLAKLKSEKEKLVVAACEFGATKEEIKEYLMREFGIE